MGFFKNLTSDLSEIGTSRSKFKSKFTNLFKLLSDYSFGEMQCSNELGRQKIIVAFNELVEFSQFVKQSDIIKLYIGTNKNVDLTIKETLKVAERLTSDVLVSNIQLTNTYTYRIIDTIKYE